MDELEQLVAALKGQLALASQLFKATCDAVGLDTAETKVTVKADTNPEISASVSLSEMFVKWEALANDDKPLEPLTHITT